MVSTAQTQGGVMEQEPARREVSGRGNGPQLISMMSCGEQPTSSTDMCLAKGNKKQSDQLSTVTHCFYAWADAATSNTSEIFDITLCYHLHFAVCSWVTLTSCSSADFHFCICLIWDPGFLSRPGTDWISFHFSFNVHSIPWENVIRSFCLSRW